MSAAPPTTAALDALFQPTHDGEQIPFFGTGQATSGAADVPIPAEWRPPVPTSLASGVGYIHPATMTELLPAEDLEAGKVRLWSMNKEPAYTISRPPLYQMRPTKRHPEGRVTSFIYSIQVEDVEDVIRPPTEWLIERNCIIVSEEDAEYLLGVWSAEDGAERKHLIGQRRYPFLFRDDQEQWIACPMERCGFAAKSLPMIMRHISAEHGG